MKIGIFDRNQQGKQALVNLLSDRLTQAGAEVWTEKDFIHLDAAPFDMVFSLGGDGTFLRTAAWVGRQNIPILGINTGRLGFLADISTTEIEETIADIFQGNYRVEERILLQCRASQPFHGKYNYALNEIAVLKRDTSSMIAIDTYLNDLFLCEYLADGLLVATPTGSTAYNLSVNGPIMLPQSNSLVLSPVAPHSLNVRPLVVPEEYTIRLQVVSRSKNFLISLDGRSEEFPSGTEIYIQKADFTIKMVKRNQQNFYDTLRNKLLWGTDARK